jgi:hypothetical protein
MKSSQGGFLETRAVLYNERRKKVMNSVVQKASGKSSAMTRAKHYLLAGFLHSVSPKPSGWEDQDQKTAVFRRQSKRY